MTTRTKFLTMSLKSCKRTEMVYRLRSLLGDAARAGALLRGVVVLALGIGLGQVGEAREPAQQSSPGESLELAEPWLEPMPVPFDPELEEQIVEVQGALSEIHKQMVRRKASLERTPDAASKAALYDQLEALRKERKHLEALLQDLVDEARASEKTAIDEALAKVRWLERRREQLEQREELIRDRQE